MQGVYDHLVETPIRDSLCRIIRFVFCYGICMSIASVTSPTPSLRLSLFFPAGEEEPHFASQGLTLLARPACLQRLTTKAVQTETDGEDQKECEE